MLCSAHRFTPTIPCHDHNSLPRPQSDSSYELCHIWCHLRSYHLLYSVVCVGLRNSVLCRQNLHYFTALLLFSRPHRVRATLISRVQSGIVARKTYYFKVSCGKFKKLGPPCLNFSTGNFTITCHPGHNTCPGTTSGRRSYCLCTAPISCEPHSHIALTPKGDSVCFGLLAAN